MKFENVVEGFGTVHALKRFASAYVVDHSKLSEVEAIAALKKAAPQYSHEENVRKAVRDCMFGADRELRTIAPIFLNEILLHRDQFISSEKETDEAVIAWEQSIIDGANEEVLLSKKSIRFHDMDLFRFVLTVAWESNDSISVDEKNLIEKIKERLLITEREYRIIEASLGKFPRPGNEIHSRAEIDDVRRQLQAKGLIATFRDSDREDHDVVPVEIANVLRKVFGNEIRRYGYEQLLDSKYVRRKEWLREAIEKCGVTVEGNPTSDELKSIIIERVPPSVLIGGQSQRDGLGIDALKQWCTDLHVRSTGLKPELIGRIIEFYDNLTSRDASAEDPRMLWYEHFEKFASRDRDFLRSQQFIDKDLEIEAKFEDATNYLFEVKLGHKPLKLVASEHPDGMLSYRDELILWDNKSKESDVSLPLHIRQFDRYIKQQEKRVAGFIVVGPSFTSDSAAEAARYRVENGTSITLITASELKSIAEEWSSKDRGSFPLGYLILPGRFDRSLVQI